ncbi:MAG: molybdenum cofactor biosynthesis protein MoaE [Ignavibacteria bacterium]|nr:molybdenum cofactor biosynthesis protein MoaE [Ignavibacteria bacterium]
MIEIVERKIDVHAVIRSVEDDSAGAIDVFIGSTRNISDGKNVLFLEYEAYVSMAKKMMEEISAAIFAKWDVKKISLVHRIGKVPIGDASVVLAVSSAHRSEAFEACRYAIDMLKKNVPIWKKEFFDNGEIWVDGNN